MAWSPCIGDMGKNGGIKHGDMVKLTTPSSSQHVMVMLIDGITEGVIAIEHGYEHKQLGAESYVIVGVEIKDSPIIKKGINLNDLGIIEHTKKFNHHDRIGFVAQKREMAFPLK